jgi:hypothetical protein
MREKAYAASKVNSDSLLCFETRLFCCEIRIKLHLQHKDCLSDVARATRSLNLSLISVALAELSDGLVERP